MAAAKREEIRREVFAPGIVLTLDEDEAAALRAVLQHVGGAPHKTRRALTASIDEALRGLGVRLGPDDITGGSLWFLEPGSSVEPF